MNRACRPSYSSSTALASAVSWPKRRYSIESPTGYEHINVGSPLSEGYVLCWSPANLPETRAFDTISNVQGFFAATRSSAAPFIDMMVVEVTGYSMWYPKTPH